MGPVIAVYFSSWSVYKGHFPSDLPEGLTHVFYAFMGFRNGKVESLDDWADNEMPVDGEKGAIASLRKLKKKGVKIVLLFGGWGEEATFQLVAKSEESRQQFANQVCEVVEKHGFDGVDFDYEYPNLASAGQDFVLLLKAVEGKLPGKIMTVATPCSREHLQFFDLAEIDKLVSFFNVMCYDLSGSWLDRAYYHLHLYGEPGVTSIHNEIRAYTERGISSGKMVLGMPLYARTFYQPHGPQIGGVFEKLNLESIDYRDLTDAEHNDLNAGAAWSYNEDTRLLATFESPETVATKAAYIKQEKYLGGFFWDSKGDLKGARSVVERFLREMHMSPPDTRLCGDAADCGL